jgi:hypothetical protein
MRKPANRQIVAVDEPPPEPAPESDNGDVDGEFDMSEFLEGDQREERAVDDFDCLETFALPQDFNPGVLEEDPPVVVRRPGAWDYFRVHPDPAMTLTVGIVEIADERDAPYLVVPAMYSLFGKLVSKRQLFVCKTSLMGPQAVFLWPAKLPQDNRRGGGGLYNETALKAAERAKTRWTKIESDEVLKCYRIFGPQEPIDEPRWPDVTLLGLMRKGFGDGYLVKSSDHPLVRRYKGLSQ